MAKCVMVSSTRQLAPVSGARNRWQKTGARKWSTCHPSTLFKVVWLRKCRFRLLIERSWVRLPVGRIAIEWLALGCVTVCEQVNHPGI